MSDWRPGAELDVLRLRARLLAQLRSFFAVREVLEVETPALAACTVTEAHIDSIPVLPSGPGGNPFFLQTSPEYHMKRLLAAGSGPIYQLCRCFRQAERGRRHNPEFSMLEWYRPGFDLAALMTEVAALLRLLLGVEKLEYLSYAEAFQRYLGLDPFSADPGALRAEVADLGLTEPDNLQRDELLNLLLSTRIEPRLDPTVLTFIHAFPASQAALARILPGQPAVAARFEAFYGGMELANGYHELADAGEQAGRFESDRGRRRELGLPQPADDQRLLAALSHGLPDCAGVAVGFDRLVMLAAGLDDIDRAMAFSWSRA